MGEAIELRVFMRAHEKRFERLSEKVREIHSYEVPEIIALPIIEGSPPYLEWLGDSLQPVSGHG